MKNWKKNGEVLTFIAPTGGVEAGVPVVIGGVLLVPTYSVGEGYECEGVRSGVFEFAKKATDVVTQLQKAYFDEDAGHFTTSHEDLSANAYPLVGVFAEAAGNGQTTASVLLFDTAYVPADPQPTSAIEFKALGAVEAGKGYVVQDAFVIALEDGSLNDIVKGLVQGKVTLPFAAADTALGLQAAYWDAANAKVTVEADNGADTAYALIGYFSKAAASTDSTAEVYLTGALYEVPSYGG